MGTRHKDSYSADVDAFLVVGGRRFRVAKTNDRTMSLAEKCELAAGTQGELLIIVDGNESSLLVALPGGVVAGQSVVPYTVTAPF